MARLGTTANPAVMNVHSMERAAELTAFCGERGWKVIVGVEPDEPEDTSDLERLLAQGGGDQRDSARAKRRRNEKRKRQRASRKKNRRRQ